MRRGGSMDVRGRGVLITGASRGLGRALASELGRRGARLMLVARGEEDLERASAERRAEGTEAYAFVADVGDKRAIHAIAGAAAAQVGPIDVLVHNASTLGAVPLVPLLDTECEDLERVLAVNLVGPFRLTKAIAGSMALRANESWRGLVIAISSDAATSAYPTWGAYGVSKAALDHLQRIWAEELPEVKFLSIDPGEMDTVMHADAMPDADRAALAKPADVAKRIAERIA